MGSVEALFRGTTVFGRKSSKKADKKPVEKVEKKKAAKAAAAPKSRKVKAPAGPVRKLPTNVYTVMLLISFLSMLLATIFMFVELSRYGGIGSWNS